MFGTEMSFDDFVKEYREENNEDMTVELIDPDSNEVTTLTKEEFEEYLNDEREEN